MTDTATRCAQDHSRRGRHDAGRNAGRRRQRQRKRAGRAIQSSAGDSGGCRRKRLRERHQQRHDPHDFDGRRRDDAGRLRRSGGRCRRNGLIGAVQQPLWLGRGCGGQSLCGGLWQQPDPQDRGGRSSHCLCRKPGSDGKRQWPGGLRAVQPSFGGVGGRRGQCIRYRHLQPDRPGDFGGGQRVNLRRKGGRDRPGGRRKRNRNVFLSGRHRRDRQRHCLRRRYWQPLAPGGTAGLVSTLAGGEGVLGSADGTGSSAAFAYPYGVAIDGSGNLYVADHN